jgi:sulfite reductase beta subunit-like hemoprotein
MKLKELKLRIAISGCPNSCAHHRIAEIGLQATAIKKNGIIKPAYDIYLRGELSNISQLFLKNILAEDVKYEIEKLIKMYLDGNFSSFYKFAEKCLKEKVNYGS